MVEFKFNYTDRSFLDDYQVTDIYHFTSEEASNKIQSNCSLRFTKNNYSNDIEDGKILIYLKEAQRRVKEQLIDEELKYFDAFSGLLLSMFQINEQNRGSNFGGAFDSSYFLSFYVLSCSLNNDDPILWYRYAERNKGKCLQFGRDDLDYWLSLEEIQENKYYGSLSSKVIYESERIIDILCEVIRNAYLDYIVLFDQNEQQKASKIFNKIGIDISVYSIFFKEKKWEIENEYRAVLIRDARNEKPKLSEKESPYIEIQFSDSYFNKMLLKNILKSKESGLGD